MELQQPHKARRCIFCGSRGISNAHIFRKEWIDYLFPQPGNPYGHLRRGHMAGSEDSQWLSWAVDFKVKDVCRTCNSGWMNELDHAAEDVLATRAAIGLDIKL